MKRTIAVIIAVLMVVMAAGTVFAAPEDAEGDSDSGDSMAVLNEILGGWLVNEDVTEYVIPEDVKAVFDKAMEGYVGMNFTPVAFLGSQLVAGTNYQILCLGAPVVPDPETGLYVLIIYEDLEGNAKITKVVDFSLADIEDADDVFDDDDDDDDDLDDAISDMMVGGWSVPDEIETIPLEEEPAIVFDAVTEGLLGVDYTPVALLGVKIISGTEFAFLVHAKTVTAQPVSYYAVMFAAMTADETFELLSIEPLDLSDFNEWEIDD